MKRLSAIALTVPSDSRTITNRPPAGKVGTASRSGLVRSKWRPVDAADAAKWGGSGAILLFTTSPVRCCRGHWVEAGGKTGKAARDAQRLATQKLLVEALMFPATDGISTTVSGTVTVLFRRRLVDRVFRLWTEVARGGRFPCRDQIEPSMLGEDWANCLVIAVQSPVQLSYLVAVA